MYETILAATDGSETARAAIEHAIGLAETVDASVHILMAVDPGDDYFRFGVSEVDAINQAANEIVDEIAGAYADLHIDIVGVVRRGKPAPTILNYADEIEADLIVVGSRGSDTSARRILGSTTDRILRGSSVPVEVIPE